MANKANIGGNNLDVFFGDAAAPWSTSVTLNPFIDVAAVTSQRHGTTPIAHLVQGVMPEITIELEEWQRDIVAQALGVATSGDLAYKAPAVGSQLPTILLRLHNPHATDNAGDLVFRECVFKNFGRTADGNGSGRLTVTLAAQLPSDGHIFEIGYTAPAS